MSSQSAWDRSDNGYWPGYRPCRRRLPKFTPLDCAPTTPFSIRVTRCRAGRGRSAVQVPISPPPTIDIGRLACSWVQLRGGMRGMGFTGACRASDRLASAPRRLRPHDLLQGRTAEAALAAAHAAACDRLDAIDLDRAERLRQRHLACLRPSPSRSGRAMVSSDSAATCSTGQAKARAKPLLEIVADVRPAAAKADHLGLWLRLAQICEQRVSRERTACLCGVRSADRRAVAGQVEISPARPSAVRLRQPEPEGRIEPEARSGQIGQLRFRLEAVAKATASQAMSRSRPRPSRTNASTWSFTVNPGRRHAVYNGNTGRKSAAQYVMPVPACAAPPQGRVWQPALRKAVSYPRRRDLAPTYGIAAPPETAAAKCRGKRCGCRSGTPDP